MLFCVFDNRLYLLETTKYYHAWSVRRLSPAVTLCRLLFQQSIAKVKILCYVEIKICVKCCLFGKFAFPVFVVPAYVPHGIGTIEIVAYVIRDIRNYKLRFRYPVTLKILKIIIKKLCLYHFFERSRDIPLQWPLLQLLSFICLNYGLVAIRGI